MMKPVTTTAAAVHFIDAVGFCVLLPVKNVPLPSLYQAAAQRRGKLEPKWDKYAERIWGWKDELPRRGKAFYAKYFRGRGTFISLKLLPYFLAMQQSAAGAGDFDRWLAAGRISHDARAIWEALATHGAMATLELRHAVKMETTAGNKRFKRAMLELQRNLIVVHFGAEKETGAWPSARFDLTARAFAKQAAAARKIAPAEARAVLARKFVNVRGRFTPGQSSAALAAELRRLFGWTKQEAQATLA